MNDRIDRGDSCDDVESWRMSVCPYCGVGCGVEIGVHAVHFHSRTRTRQVEKLRNAAPEPRLEIHPQDARRYAILDDVLVQVTSRRGFLLVRSLLSDRIKPGSVFLPYHFGGLGHLDSGVNVLTHRAFDERAGQPEYKACAVRVTMA